MIGVSSQLQGSKTCRTAAMAMHRRPGRPSKGQRELVRARLPKPLAAALRAEAQDRGLSINDLIGELVARETGVPYSTPPRLPMNA